MIRHIPVLAISLAIALPLACLAGPSLAQDRGEEPVEVERYEPARPFYGLVAPDLLSVPHDAALEEAARLGLGVKFFEDVLPPKMTEYFSADPGGEYLVWMRQAPEPGQPIEKGMDLHVSVYPVQLAAQSPIRASFNPGPTRAGTPWKAVPDLVGRSLGSAQGAMDAAGLRLVLLSDAGGEGLPAAGQIVGHFPPARYFIPADTEVRALLIEAPPGPDYAPPLSANGEPKQQRWLGQGPALMPAGFEPDASHTIVKGIPKTADEFTSVWIDAGAIEEDLSWVTVPSFVGLSPSTATSTASGVPVELEMFSNTVPPTPLTGPPPSNSKVDRQAPEEGTVVESGSTVNVVIVVQVITRKT